MKKTSLGLFTILMMNFSYATGKLLSGNFQNAESFAINSSRLNAQLNPDKYYMISPINKKGIIQKKYHNGHNYVEKNYNNFYSERMNKILINLNNLIVNEPDHNKKTLMENSRISKTSYKTGYNFTEERAEHISIYLTKDNAEENHREQIVTKIADLFESKKIKVRGFEVANGGHSKKVLATFSIMIGGGNGQKEIYKDIDTAFHLAIFKCENEIDAANLVTILNSVTTVNKGKPIYGYKNALTKDC